jgi:hypothetical protein
MQWWVVWWNPAGSAASYRVVSGTRAAAQKVADTAISATIAGPYASQADATAAAKAGDKGTNAPAPQLTPQIPNIAGGAGGSVVSDSTGLAAIGAFFAKLGQASIWLRVAEVALGLVLVAVGMARVVPSFTPAMAIAKKVGVKI